MHTHTRSCTVHSHKSQYSRMCTCTLMHAITTQRYTCPQLTYMHIHRHVYIQTHALTHITTHMHTEHTCTCKSNTHAHTNTHPCPHTTIALVPTHTPAHSLLPSLSFPDFSGWTGRLLRTYWASAGGVVLSVSCPIGVSRQARWVGLLTPLSRCPN